MVSIVLVSHSRELSEAAKALAEQQVQGRVKLAAVGGSENPFQPFGTDPVAIAEAIQAVYSDDGVLVLMDLGSALISGKVALDLLEPELVAHVHLCAGPFVEGALAACVQASIGMNLLAVTREAEEAMQAKRAVLLHEELPPASAVANAGPSTGMPAGSPAEGASVDVTVVNPAGLHFGPAARFIQAAAGFDAHITVSNLTAPGGPVDATRFNQLLSLGVEQNHRIRIAASGLEAEQSVRALGELVQSDVGEAAPALASTTQWAPAGEAHGRVLLHGAAASPGVAVGVAVVMAEPVDLLHGLRRPVTAAAAPLQEWERCCTALEAARRELDTLAAEVEVNLGAAQAAMFQAHRLLLADDDLVDTLRQRIVDLELPVGEAVQQTFAQMAAHLRWMAGTVFQQRSIDVEDVGRRVLRLLYGIEERPIELPEHAVIVAHDLAPSQTARLDRSRVAAFCTATGGPHSHTAILARSMGIPAVVGIGDGLLAATREGEPVAVDGIRGQVVVGPDEATAAAFAAACERALSLQQAAWRSAQQPTNTRDGLRVEVVANLGAAADVAIALAAGAEGVGLLRTEFLFQDRSSPPTEDEQYEAYRQVAEELDGRPLVIRTLDIGGDKPAPYFPMPNEANPFLGWRAIRISLALPELFKTQLRALLRAAAHGHIHVMFPMISTVDEVLRSQALLAVTAGELAATRIPHRADVPVGIMIEVPAAVQIADRLAPLVDFFSIGTNDLAQYTFAADRGNLRVAELADPLHPAVLRQIDHVIRAAHIAGRWCGLCGEMAGQPDAIPILLGLGLDEFSMAPALIPAAKQRIGRLTVRVARRLAQKALGMADGDAVRNLVREQAG